MNARLDVTMLPAEQVPRGNPYLDYLEAELNALGVRVGHDGEGFRWRHLLSPAPLPRVFHLHWINSLHTGGRSWQTLLLSASYALKLAVLRARGSRLVWTVHNLVPHYRNTMADRLCARLTARLADGLIVHNEAAGEIVTRRLKPRRPPRVFLMGEYTARYGPKLPRAEARARLGLPVEPLLFLVFGQIRRNKGIDRLVRLFAALDPAQTLLYMAGTRASRDAVAGCRELIARCPHITLREGFVPDEEIPVLFGAADAFLYAGDDIILSTGSVVLALSYGLPILARDLACLRGVVPAESRIDFDADDEKQAKAVLATLDRAALETAGAAGKAAMKQRTWADAARLHREVYGL